MWGYKVLLNNSGIRNNHKEQFIFKHYTTDMNMQNESTKTWQTVDMVVIHQYKMNDTDYFGNIKENSAIICYITGFGIMPLLQGSV